MFSRHGFVGVRGDVDDGHDGGGRPSGDALRHFSAGRRRQRLPRSLVQKRLGNADLQVKRKRKCTRSIVQKWVLVIYFLPPGPIDCG